MATDVAAEIGCVCMAPDEGERIRIFDEEVAVKVTGAETAGVYALAAISVAPGGGPPLHAHPGNETFYVLSGEFAFTLRDARGAATFRGGPGTVVHAPGGAPHRFENVSPTRGSLLVIAAPDAIDFLRELGAAFPPGAEPDMEQMLAIHAKYNVATFHGEAGSRPEPAKDGATSERARMLAWRVEQAHETLVAALVRCTPRRWRAICADTGWTVGVEAHHVAVNEAAILHAILAAAEGQPHAPITPEALDAINARHAIEFAGIGKARTLALLRRNGAKAVAAYRRLSDAQLARTATLVAGEPPASVADWIEELALGEIASHSEYIRAAIAG